MFHWFDVVTNTRGDALGGWQVGLVELDTQNVVPIFSDENSTPIVTVSGVANRAIADENGNYDFFVPSGTYTLQFFNSAGVFQRSQRFVAMFGSDDIDAADASATAAAASALAADASADAAAVSETAAAVSEINAAASAVSAESAKDGAEAARDAALLTGRIFPTTASALGRGVQGSGAITGGSGGTNGTFPLVTSGGTQVLPVRGTFTVSGGAVTAISVQWPGYYTTDPTGFDFSASAGLTGASATPTMGVNAGVGEFFLVPQTGTDAFDIYEVTSGPAATLRNSLGSAAQVAANEATAARTQENQGDYFSRDQLFDPDAVTDGKFVNTTGGLNDNASYAASEHIAWPEGVTQVTMSRGNWLAQYTLSNGTFTFVSGSNANPSANDYTLSKASGATHFRVSVLKTVVTVDKFSIEPGAGPLALHRPDFIKTVDGGAIKGATVQASAAAFLVPGKNLLDESRFQDGKSQSTSDTIVDNASLSLSHDIPITPGVTYTYDPARFRTVLNKLGYVIPANSEFNDGSTTYTAVSGDAYMRLTYLIAEPGTVQCEVGSVATGFEPFGYKLGPEIIGAGTGFVSKWSGKKLVSFGDSLVAQAEWQPEAAAALGMTHTAFGVGGRTISNTATGGTSDDMYLQATIDGLPVAADVDALLVLAGTNDWAQSAPLGTFKSVTGSGATAQTVLNTTDTEFFGALNLMIQRLVTKYPTKRICLCAPPWSELPGRVPATWATASTNTQGLTINAYGDAIAEAANWWGLPFIDFRESGINSVNIASFMKDDGGWLHPNSTLGGPRLAEIAIGRMRALEPLS